MCVQIVIQSEDECEFNTVKARTFLQIEACFVTYCSEHHSAYGGIEENKPHPCFVLHVLAHTHLSSL